MCNAFDVGFGDKTIEVIIIIFLDIIIAKDRQMSNNIYTHLCQQYCTCMLQSHKLFTSLLY